MGFIFYKEKIGCFVEGWARAGLGLGKGCLFSIWGSACFAEGWARAGLGLG